MEYFDCILLNLYLEFKLTKLHICVCSSGIYVCVLSYSSDFPFESKELTPINNISRMREKVTVN